MQEVDAEFPGFDFAALMHDAISNILSKQDYPSFIEWMADRFRSEMEHHDIDDGRQGRGLASVLGRRIWNATPLPTNDWRPMPVTVPGRNDPCPCTSGRKFKHCCANLDRLPSIETDEIWGIVIDQLTPGELDRLIAAKRIPPLLIGTAAQAMLDDNRPEAAVQVLAPLFTPPLDHLDERLLDALDTLADAYQMQGDDAARIAMLDTVHRQAPRFFRAEAAQRLASIYADLGERDVAWGYFRSALRHDPDSPSAAVLELTLLVTEGRNAEAKDRASFWLHRFAKMETMPSELLDLLRRASNDPERALATADLSARGLDADRIVTVLTALADRPVADDYQVASADSQPPNAGDPDLESAMFEQLVKMGVPAAGIGDVAKEMAATLRNIQQDDLSTGPADRAGDSANYCTLRAPSLEQIEKRWHAVFPLAKPLGTLHSPEQDAWTSSSIWLEFLEIEPRAADSFDVLDDIVLALESDAIGDSQWTDRTVLEPILARAWRMIEAAMQAGPADAVIPWGIVDNRPALRLAVGYYFVLHRLARFDDAMKACAQLLRWNPDDNHGLRTALINIYLETRQWRAALDLCARYEDDTEVNIVYGRCLAHFASGATDAAQSALRTAVRVNKHVPRALTAVRVEEDEFPAMDFAPGSEEEALQYRDETLDLWENIPGALAWLKGTAPSGARRRRR